MKKSLIQNLNSLAFTALVQISIGATPVAAQGQASSADQSPLREAVLQISKTKSVDLYVESLHSKISDSLHEFIKSKLGGAKSFPKITWSNIEGVKFYSTSGAAISVSIISSKEKLYKVNNQSVRIDLRDAPELNWNKIEKLLPVKFSSNSNTYERLFNLVISSAHAEEPPTADPTNQLLTLTIFSLLANSQSIKNCGDVTSFLQTCVDNIGQMDAILREIKAKKGRFTSAAEKQKFEKIVENANALRNSTAESFDSLDESCKKPAKELTVCLGTVISQSNSILAVSAKNSGEKSATGGNGGSGSGGSNNAK